MNRRIPILLLSVALLSATRPSAVLGAQEPDLRVTLLGTGSPRPRMDRFGPSILVEAGVEKFLFDVGRGATQRLAQMKISFADITGVFLTHLHSDHLVGLPDLWLTGWIVSDRTAPLRIWGPQGTASFATHLEAAFAFDLQIRVADDKASPAGGHLVVKEVGEGVVFDSGGVRVTAFVVDHGPVRPALGYRVDYRGRSVVLSGDTRPSDNLIRHATGVDLLIHEVAFATDSNLAASARTRGVIAHHTTPVQAAEVFTRTHPKLAVFSHIALRPGASESDMMTQARAGYSGPLVLGQDLMQFTVGDTIGVGTAGQ